MNKAEILEVLTEKKESGIKIIGLFPHQMIPEELIYASGAIPLRLSFAGPEEITIKGTEYLTPATCPLARSIVGFFEDKNHFFSLIDLFIGGNYCNGDLCASEYISEYFKVPFIHFTIPWVVNPQSLKFYESLIIDLKNDLENAINVEISNENLINSIDQYNQIRIALQNISKKIGMGTQFQDILNEFYLLGPENFLTRVDDKKIETPKNDSEQTEIAFTGSYVAIDDFILELIEDCGFEIKYNNSESIFYFEQTIPAGDPYSVLSEFYLKQHYSARMLETDALLKDLASKVKTLGIEGIILHVLKFCDPYVAIKKDVKDFLNDQGLTVLELERNYDQSLGQLKTRIEAFKEMIG
ncbi:MAG: 2-hydroxyacyl-CoA dehydratase subunit D [Candidatus Helarchaeota archaeon]